MRWGGAFRARSLALRALRAQLGQGPQAREVVGSHRQRQTLVDLIQSEPRLSINR
jgi:hypothetical protein